MNTSGFNLITCKTAFIVAALVYVLMMVGCSSPEPKPTVVSTPSKSKVVTQKQTHRPVVAKSNATGNKLVSVAESVLGSPYKYGGSSPNGFDCSGLVYYSHNKLGISVPRTTRQQARHASDLSLSEIEPGDVLFFRIYGNNISHVGIYTGNNQFIHAPKTGKFVSHASITDPYWKERFIKAGRLH